MEAKKIRNFALIGHGGAGKTSLAEAMFYKAGITNRLGSVEQGNTIMDFDPEEVQRQISINLGVGHLEWKEHLFNIIDTPGYLDFAGEVCAALRIADNVVVVIDAASGVEVGTEKYYEIAKMRNLPTFIYINKMTAQEINLDALWEDLKQYFGHGVTPFQIPLGKGANFKGVFDLIHGDLNSLDPEFKEKAEEEKEKFRENIIELSEELLEKYMEGEEIKDEELIPVLKDGIIKREIIPVIFGDAKHAIGIEELLDTLMNFGASPLEGPEEKGMLSGEEVIVEKDPNGKTMVFVFKTLQEAHLGELYFVKVISGKLQSGTELLNVNKRKSEKINQIYFVRGKERKETMPHLSQ